MELDLLDLAASRARLIYPIGRIFSVFGKEVERIEGSPSFFYSQALIDKFFINIIILV